jgi:radical SAM superfamily enzyme YgiQ (UPF0313 family)
MSDTIFLQFYVEGGIKRPDYSFYNGFSDTWNFCKQKGDFIWLDAKNLDKVEIPIKKGTIYASIAFQQHFVKIYNWALQNPNVKFIVGGPFVCETTMNTSLSNLYMTMDSVEDYFGIPNYSKEWWFEYPEHLEQGRDVKLVFSLNTDCYWNKCVFCDYTWAKNRRRPANNKFNFKDLQFSGIKTIRLETPTLTGDHITNLLPNLPFQNDLRYLTQMRCDKNDIKLLREAFSKMEKNPLTLNESTIHLGVDFPSERMLNFVKKGITYPDIIETIELLNSNNITIQVNIIIGWENLEREDLSHLEQFINFLNTKTNFRIVVFKLFCIRGTPIYELYKDRIDIKQDGNIHSRGYYPKLSKEKYELSLEAAAIIKKCKQTVYDYSGFFKEIK